MKKGFFRISGIACALAIAIAMFTPAAYAEAANDTQFTVTKTGIQADGVFNTGGYGSLAIHGNGATIYDEDVDVVPPQIALVDSSGTFKFPYRNDSEENCFTNGARFRYSDGIVSLTLGSAYENGDPPQYYTTDGGNAFTLKETHNEYTDANGIFHEESTSYLGGPIQDGYAVVIKKLYSFWTGQGAGGGSSDSENTTQIINKNGVVTCELPQEYNETIQWGAGGFATKKSLGWCGEGLFAFFEHTQADDYDIITEGKGYMDPTGKTVIDLAGRGYTNLFPFHQGLAAVVNQAGKYGFIGKTGTEVIPCAYEGAASFGSDGLCAVKKDGKWGYIDRQNKTVISFEYDNAYGAENGLASVKKGEKCGLLDYNNNIAIPLEYDDISSYEGGVAYAVKGSTLYIITESKKPAEPDDSNSNSSTTNSVNPTPITPPVTNPGNSSNNTPVDSSWSGDISNGVRIWKHTEADGTPSTGVRYIENSNGTGAHYIFNNDGTLVTNQNTVAAGSNITVSGDGEILINGNLYYLNPDRNENDPRTCYVMTDYLRIRPNYAGQTWYDKDGITFVGWMKNADGGLRYQTRISDNYYLIVWRVQDLPACQHPDHPGDPAYNLPAGRYFFDDEGVLVQKEGWNDGKDGKEYYTNSSGLVTQERAKAA